jgi:hypothetical protein
MAKQVTSREYKLMLHTGRFQDRKQGIKAFWDVVKYVVNNTRDAHEVKIKTQDLEKPFKERLTWYMDTTPGKDFNTAGWVLRMREEEEESGKKKFKTTLKFRSPDHFISASKDLSASVSVEKGLPKFEEDVVPAFSSKFSHSTSVETEKGDLFKNVSDVAGLFPGIMELELAGDIKIQKVNDFTASEVVYRVGNFKVGNGDDKIKVKCCFSFWYLTGKEDMYPLAVEFSFDYDRAEEKDFPLHVCEAAKYIFSTLQKQCGWVDLGGTTKTAFAYSGF